jgi:hypothetical protein
VILIDIGTKRIFGSLILLFGRRKGMRRRWKAKRNTTREELTSRAIRESKQKSSVSANAMTPQHDLTPNTTVNLWEGNVILLILFIRFLSPLLLTM